MDNNKKLYEGLLKADGINPAVAEESDRIAFRKMLDGHTKLVFRRGILRIIIKSRITKFACAAAVIMIVLFGGLAYFNKSETSGNFESLHSYDSSSSSNLVWQMNAGKLQLEGGNSEISSEVVAVGRRFEKQAKEEIGQAMEPPQNDPASIGRLVIYNAVMNMVVDNISKSLSKIEAVTISMGGYMQKMDSRSIILRVPSQKFHDLIAETEKLGEVTQKEIKGSDVTDEMRDLNIRLQNAESIRQRLTKLLDKADKVEDALKIEKELGRVTEEIELLKGKIAHLKDSIAYCTLTIYFNSPVPQQDVTITIPFQWIYNLGSGLTSSSIGSPYISKFLFWHQPIFDIPDGYVRYYETRSALRAMSADDSVISAQRYRNYKGGNTEFWAKLVNRVLTEQKTIYIKETSGLKLANGSSAKVLTGSKQIGHKQFGYMAAMAANENYVYVIEAWGPIEQFQKDRSKLENAVRSMRFD